MTPWKGGGRDRRVIGVPREFVADNFRKAGLQAGVPGGYLQEVRLETRQIVEANSSLKLLAGHDARPLKFGDDAGLLASR